MRAVWWIAAFACTPEPPAPVELPCELGGWVGEGDAWLELGGGETAFEPFRAKAPEWVVKGAQGAQHLTVSARMPLRKAPAIGRAELGLRMLAWGSCEEVVPEERVGVAITHTGADVEVWGWTMVLSEATAAAMHGRWAWVVGSLAPVGADVQARGVAGVRLGCPPDVCRFEPDECRACGAAGVQAP